MFMETILTGIATIFKLIFFIAYICAGYASIKYIKYHLMGVRAEYTADLKQFYFDSYAGGLSWDGLLSLL